MDVATFRRLLEPRGQALLAAIPPYDESTALNLGEHLRRDHDPELVAAAMTQARLRARAHGKFGDSADRLYFTAQGLEQATRRPVAQLRARRYAAGGLRRVADLGCGVGGDALALASAGVAVLAVERDPLVAEVAQANAAALGLADGVEVRCADVTEVDLGGCDAAYCDPARRTERGRTFDPAAWSPPWSFLLDLVRRVAAVGVKVAPGIPHDLVPHGAEAEWVSDGGAVKEAARWLYEPDGAVVRAGLVAEVVGLVDGWLIDPTIAYVASDRLVRTPFASAYEVTDVMPFSLKRLRALLRSREVGSVVVKKRGSAIEPEQLRRQLRLSGRASAVVVLTRVAGAPTVLLARAVTS